MVLTRGDLVTYYKGIGESSQVEAGIVLDIYPSNVYEPEEAEIFVNGEFYFVQSRHLQIVNIKREKQQE